MWVIEVVLAGASVIFLAYYADTKYRYAGCLIEHVWQSGRCFVQHAE